MCFFSLERIKLLRIACCVPDNVKFIRNTQHAIRVIEEVILSATLKDQTTCT
jgi:hypothetical protein